MGRRTRRVLPGFGLSLGVTVTYLSILVLFPLALVFVKSASGGASGAFSAAFSPRALAAYRLTFGASAIAATVNVVFGVIVAWVLVRYRFAGRAVVDALIDLPFALPTAVGGIALAAVYSGKGWVGRFVEPLGVKLIYSEIGVVIALTFIGLPFVVRTVQPVIAEIEPEHEEAAATLGASRWQTLRLVILPQLAPAILTGFALAFARGLGEYGSVIFVSNNLPMRTEIAPLLIMTKLEQYDYAGAASIAAVLLVASFALLLGINRLQARSHARWMES